MAQKGWKTLIYSEGVAYAAIKDRTTRLWILSHL